MEKLTKAKPKPRVYFSIESLEICKAMKTKLTEMLGIEYPIICGGMMRLAYPPLCAAISNAGGLGNLTSAMYESKEDFVAAIREVRALTDKPFIVNITLLPHIGVSQERYTGYFEALAEEGVEVLPCLVGLVKAGAEVDDPGAGPAGVAAAVGEAVVDRLAGRGDHLGS